MTILHTVYELTIVTVLDSPVELTNMIGALLILNSGTVVGISTKRMSKSAYAVTMMTGNDGLKS